MPLPTGFYPVLWTMALPYASRGPGTYLSPSYANSFDLMPTADLQILLYAGELIGTPSMAYTLQSSLDGVTWIDMPGTGGSLSEIGTASTNVSGIGEGVFIRFAATVTGEPDDTMTYRALAALYPESAI